jgi:hypothetical protein
MWPKAFLQLLELAPHVTRLVPAADRYLQSRAEGRDTQRQALEQVADGLRGDMGKVAEGMRGNLAELAATQTGISHQLNQQSETLANMAADLRAARLTADEADARMRRIELRMSQLGMAVLAALVLIAVVGVIAVLTMLRVRQYVHGS